MNRVNVRVGGIEALAQIREQGSPSLYVSARRKLAESLKLPRGDYPRCATCNGAGWVVADGEEALCDACESLGYVVPRTSGALCSVCGGAGYVRDPSALPTNARGMRCPKCSKKVAKAIRNETPSLASLDMNIPAGYEDFTFETFAELEIGDEQRGAMTLIKHLATRPDSFIEIHGKHGAVLEGNVGTGKTGLAVSALKATAKWSERPRFVYWPESLSRLRSYYSGEPGNRAELVRSMTTPDVLVLDDFGRGRGEASEHDQGFAEEVLDARTRKNSGVLIVTTNLDHEMLSQVMGARAASRLAKLCLRISVRGADIRGRTG